jgi:hypothetical protein
MVVVDVGKEDREAILITRRFNTEDVRLVTLTSAVLDCGGNF